MVLTSLKATVLYYIFVEIDCFCETIYQLYKMPQSLKQYKKILKACNWIQKLKERKKRKFDSDWYYVF